MGRTIDPLDRTQSAPASKSKKRDRTGQGTEQADEAIRVRMKQILEQR
ncbi:hypothetical protein [Asaia prunellae]|nr:hypothetical protein [Asaia prunellae]